MPLPTASDICFNSFINPKFNIWIISNVHVHLSDVYRRVVEYHKTNKRAHRRGGIWHVVHAPDWLRLASVLVLFTTISINNLTGFPFSTHCFFSPPTASWRRWKGWRTETAWRSIPHTLLTRHGPSLWHSTRLFLLEWNMKTFKTEVPGLFCGWET